MKVHYFSMVRILHGPGTVFEACVDDAMADYSIRHVVLLLYLSQLIYDCYTGDGDNYTSLV